MPKGAHSQFRLPGGAPRCLAPPRRGAAQLDPSSASAAHALGATPSSTATSPSRERVHAGDLAAAARAPGSAPALYSRGATPVTGGLRRCDRARSVRCDHARPRACTDPGGRPRAAASVLHTAAGLQPTHTDAYFELGVALQGYRSQGRAHAYDVLPSCSQSTLQRTPTAAPCCATRPVPRQPSRTPRPCASRQVCRGIQQPAWCSGRSRKPKRAIAPPGGEGAGASTLGWERAGARAQPPRAPRRSGVGARGARAVVVGQRGKGRSRGGMPASLARRRICNFRSWERSGMALEPLAAATATLGPLTAWHCARAPQLRARRRRAAQAAPARARHRARGLFDDSSGRGAPKRLHNNHRPPGAALRAATSPQTTGGT